IAGPPAAKPGRSASAAPGKITTPALPSVSGEIARAEQMFPANTAVKPAMTLITGDRGQAAGFGSEPALRALGKGRGVGAGAWRPSAPPASGGAPPDPGPRQKRQLLELVEYTQRLLRLSHKVREQFWSKAQPGLGAEKWPEQ